MQKAQRLLLRKSKSPGRRRMEGLGRDLTGHVAPGDPWAGELTSRGLSFLIYKMRSIHHDNLRAPVKLKEEKVSHFIPLGQASVCSFVKRNHYRLSHRACKTWNKTVKTNGEHTISMLAIYGQILTAYTTGNRIHKWTPGLNFLICKIGQPIQSTKTKFTNSSWISSWHWRTYLKHWGCCGLLLAGGQAGPTFLHGEQSPLT